MRRDTVGDLMCCCMFCISEKSVIFNEHDHSVNTEGCVYAEEDTYGGSMQRFSLIPRSVMFSQHWLLKSPLPAIPFHL